MSTRFNNIKCTRKCTKLFTLKWSGKDFCFNNFIQFLKVWAKNFSGNWNLTEIGGKSFPNWSIKIVWFLVVKYFSKYRQNFFPGNEPSSVYISFLHITILKLCHKFYESSVNNTFLSRYLKAFYFWPKSLFDHRWRNIVMISELCKMLLLSDLVWT